MPWADDPLQCELVVVAGRTYRNQANIHGRKLPVPQQCVSAPAASSNQQQPVEDETEEPTECSRPEAALEAVPLLDDGLITRQGLEYVTRISADAELYPVIIGKGGARKRELEAQCGVRLTIPKPGQPGNEVVITAPTKEALSAAARAIQQLLGGALASSRLAYNYFVSLPLADTNVKSKFQELQQQAVGLPHAAELGIDEFICVSPDKLHLTVAMLKLYSEERREQARMVLAGLAPKVQALLGAEPLLVALRGLETMNDDPSKAHVLYLQVHEAGPEANQRRLVKLRQLLISEFASCGLMSKDTSSSLKLHATVLKTSNRRSQQEGDTAHTRGPAPQRAPFDARPLLSQLGDFDAGQQALQAVHISQVGSVDDSTAHYVSIGQLSLVS